MDLYQGNNIDLLKDLESNSVDSCATDPPYGLSFMGKKWDYDVPSIEFWTELLRVLKPGAFVLSFGGTRTYHRMVVNMEDAGFEIRDQLQWLYGSGFPKSHNIGKKTEGWDGFGTALKPSNEPICLARKPLSEKTIVDNVLKWGVGGLNIDGCRIEGKPRTTHAAGNVVTCQAASGHLKGKKPHGPEPGPQGRWPANTLFDYAAAEMLDEQSGVLKNGGQNKTSIKGKGMFLAGSSDGTSKFSGDKGGASRFFYVAKASKRERGTDNNHPTVKPIKLMQYLVRLITPPNGTCLDPFMGSGTTGIAAKNEGLKFIGMELNQEYFEIAQRRINDPN